MTFVQFLREMPLWYRIYVGLIFAWFLFVFVEWSADTFFGGPLWLVTCPC